MRSSNRARRICALALMVAVSIAVLGGQALRTAPSPSTTTATLRSLRREVLPEAVRITIELDGEVPLNQNRLDDPARAVVDLNATRAVPALADTVFKYDTDVVREIRLNRLSNGSMRLVIDLEGVKRYSLYSLYSPYRIVIDCEREVQIAVRPASEESTEEPGLPFRTPAAPAANSGGKFSVARQLGLGVSKIVIDAGHGGRDPGAAAFGISEADLVLDVALRVEKLLKQRPGFETVLTRRSNEYVTLEQRTEMANREGADLFLSIHANASATPTARGVETYFLNFALNRQAEAVAARENASSGLTMNSLPGIIKSITLNSKLNESRDFAALIQRSMVRGLRPANTAIKDLGVKQAPFMVLIGAAMPSVLAEISFVTNRAEARLLKTGAYRQKIAESLVGGIIRYQQTLKKVQTASLNQ